MGEAVQRPIEEVIAHARRAADLAYPPPTAAVGGAKSDAEVIAEMARQLGELKTENEALKVAQGKAPPWPDTIPNFPVKLPDEGT